MCEVAEVQKIIFKAEKNECYAMLHISITIIQILPGKDFVTVL